jgi:hypothetical protein
MLIERPRVRTDAELRPGIEVEPNRRSAARRALDAIANHYRRRHSGGRIVPQLLLLALFMVIAVVVLVTCLG